MKPTTHARIRGQQRGIPMFVLELLQVYGVEAPDDTGCLCVRFPRKHQKKLAPVLGKWLNAYMVLDPTGMRVITTGWLH